MQLYPGDVCACMCVGVCMCVKQYIELDSWGGGGNILYLHELVSI